MGRADLHVHTCHDEWGDGNDTVPEIMAHVQKCTDLNLLGITDHDSTAAGRAARELHADRDYRFALLPGTEVTTTSGHLLCYFTGEIFDVPSLRSLAWTARFVHEHGGICLLAHPVYPPWLRRSAMDAGSGIIRDVDGVEVINGGLRPKAQARLGAIGEALDGRAPLVGNSDAHHRQAIGSVVTEFPGTSLDDFLRALSSRQTRPLDRERVAMPRAATRFTRRRSMTRPGWVRNLYREVRQVTRPSNGVPGRD